MIKDTRTMGLGEGGDAAFKRHCFLTQAFLYVDAPLGRKAHPRRWNGRHKVFDRSERHVVIK